MGTTKKDLIDRIAKRTRTTQRLVKVVLQELFAEVVAGLGQNDRIELRDFGVFEPRTSAPRIGRNPRTFQAVQVPAKPRVAFKPGRLMKQQLNGGAEQRPGIPRTH